MLINQYLIIRDERIERKNLKSMMIIPLWANLKFLWKEPHQIWPWRC